MAKIIIDQDKCKGCFLCISFCPKGLIIKSTKLNKRGINYVELKGINAIRRSSPSLKASASEDGCLGCMMCAIICPDACIEVWK